MDTRAKILIVDDDESIVGLLQEILRTEGFQTHGCLSGQDAIKELAARTYDLVLLDVMMPGMNGFETCQRMREISHVPIVFLTARNDESDTVLGLSLGADDYVVKPFKPRELVARVRARIRRSKDFGAQLDSSVFDSGGLLLDSGRHFASLHDVELKLTPKEFKMLRMLVEHAGKPVAIREIFERIWEVPYNSFDSNTVMVHIRRLRKKMEQIDSSREFITTIFGVGYKLDVESHDASAREAEGEQAWDD